MPIRRFLAGLYSLLLAAQAAPGFADAAVVLVPAGPFTMGIDHPRATDERPSHQVFLSAFSIDRHEVSNHVGLFKCQAVERGARAAALPLLVQFF